MSSQETQELRALRDTELSPDDPGKNDVLQAGEFPEPRERKLSSLERFYVDVARVYQFEHEQARAEKLASQSAAMGGNGADGSDTKATEPGSSVGLSRMKDLLGFAMFQVDNLLSVANKVCARRMGRMKMGKIDQFGSELQLNFASEATERHDDNTPSACAARLRALMAAKSEQLSAGAKRLAYHTRRLRARVTRGRRFSNRVLRLSSFWSMRIKPVPAGTAGTLILSHGVGASPPLLCELRMGESDDGAGGKDGVVQVCGLGAGFQEGIAATYPPHAPPNDPSVRLISAQQQQLQRIAYATLMTQAGALGTDDTPSDGAVASVSANNITVTPAGASPITLHWPDGPGGPLEIVGAPQRVSEAINLVALRDAIVRVSVRPVTPLAHSEAQLGFGDRGNPRLLSFLVAIAAHGDASARVASTVRSAIAAALAHGRRVRVEPFARTVAAESSLAVQLQPAADGPNRTLLCDVRGAAVRVLAASLGSGGGSGDGAGGEATASDEGVLPLSQLSKSLDGVYARAHETRCGNLRHFEAILRRLCMGSDDGLRR